MGATDIYHPNVRKRGVFGQAFLLFFGTPSLGKFSCGIYLREFLRGRMFASVLDAGCGDGTFAFYVAARLPSAQVTGVDIGEQGLHDAESNLNICHRIHQLLPFSNLRFERQDLRELDADEAYDFIYSFDVLEHIRENKLVLKGLYKALRTRGFLLVRIPNRVQKRLLDERFTAEHMRWAAVEHVGQHYEMPSLLQDLKEIGYEVVSAKYTDAFWGRLSFELFEAFRFYRVPEILQYALVPFLKVLRWLDSRAEHPEGDGLLVLCRK